MRSCFGPHAKAHPPFDQRLDQRRQCRHSLMAYGRRRTRGSRRVRIQQEVGDERSDDLTPEGHGQRDLQDALRGRRKIPDLPRGHVQLIQDGADPAEVERPCFGQRDASGGSDQQAHTKTPLQMAQPSGDDRGIPPELTAGSLEASGVGHGRKRHQIIETFIRHD
jgi:hypothetical protein